MSTRRQQSLAKLGPAFKVAPSLPLRDGALRPIEQIARRLMALDALFTWASDMTVAHEERLRRYAEPNVDWLTDSERAIWALARPAAQRHIDTIGWRLENMWPLAWILGLELEPGFDGAMIDGPKIRAMYQFLPKTTETVADFLARAKPRDEAVVLDLADVFYCAHNAARSAQLGGQTVPAGWHPVASGGVIHERRHALWWATSPGVAWDDTNLST